MTYLNIAIAKGDFDTVKDFIENQTYSVNDTGYFYSHDTPLAMAAKHDRHEIMEYLIANGADVNAQGQWLQGDTPLEAALKHNNISALAVLLANDNTHYSESLKDVFPDKHHSLFSEVEIKDFITKYSLFSASEMQNHWAIEKILSKTTTNKAEEYLVEAVSKNDIYLIKEILNHTDANINIDQWNLIEISQNTFQTNHAGITLLKVAIENNYFDVTKTLIEMGADIAHQDIGYNLCTPLHLAAMKGNINIAKLLIENGASLEATDYETETPLYYAVRENQTEMVDLLASYGANVKHKNDLNESVLELALKMGSSEIASTLVMHGAEMPEAVKPIALDQVIFEDLIITPANQEAHQNVSHANDATQVAIYNPASAVNAYIAAPDQNENYV